MAEGKRGGWNRQDAESEAMLYQGASITQLSTLFKMDNRDVKAKLEGLAPCGKRGNVVIYNIKEAAQKLVAPVITDYDEFIRKMTVAELPVMLRKEFWAGMRSRQLYEEQDGKLWKEEEVAEALSEIFKRLKMSILLIKDSVNREVELSEKQRAVVTRYIDKSLESLHASVTDHFTKRLSRTGVPAPAPIAASEPDEDEEL
ncbi:putative small terminase subunit [Xanthomonas phage FoX4]|uniref:Putative small terminase subunit n=1 Tax=Xanthomonas phage FoX4 TaxID=2723900 RepID=A0A858WJ83_9CAUD|nr:terminase small subunit [Xanthomonas phage FoX4]QJI52969.1 putative small terminase subunit [Xanthomonas phage FoX4]